MEPPVLEGAGWSTFGGHITNLAVGLLVGSAPQVFMMKLKDISDALSSPKAIEIP